MSEIGRSAPLDLSSLVATSAASLRSKACRLPIAESLELGSVDPTEVRASLGSTAPFTLRENHQNIYIYSPRALLTEKDASALEGLEQRLGSVIAAMKANSLWLQLVVPHASAIGNLVTAVRRITPTGIDVVAVGADRVRISSASAPDCQTLATFLDDLTSLAHHTHPDAANASVFYLDLASVGAAVHATPIAFAQGGVASAGPSAGMAQFPDSKPATMQGEKQKGSAGKPGSKTPDKKEPAPKVGPPASTQSASTEDAIVSPEVSTSSNADTPATPSLPAFSVNGKDLLFAAGTPGDDSAITEKKRIVALLDLPQPQVLINAWVMQNSTSKARDFGELTTMVHESVNEHNRVLERSIYLGWAVLKQRTESRDYFDVPFYDYLTQRTIFETRPPAVGRQSSNAPTAMQWIKETAGTPSPGAPDAAIGACKQGRYCLGYTTLFRALQPRLTDLLLTLIAAQQPYAVASEAIAAMGPRSVDPAPGKSLRTGTVYADSPNIQPESCEEQDNIDLSKARGSGWDSQGLALHCFQRAMELLRGPTELQRQLPSQLGPTRAAVADFLFNYKMSQQYPHEFVPYDLTQSAQVLDAALAPFIEAFNHDLQAFQNYLRGTLDKDTEGKKLARDKNIFLNDGIITVRTTSGDAASVNATSQSFLNVSRAPSISEVVSNIVNSKPGGQSSGVLGGVAGNLSFNEAQVLLGALESYQTTEANIGRQLNLTVKPRSLPGASAAEIDIRLNAADTPTSPNYWTPGAGGGAKGTADISRVAQHEVTSHVRVDSIKLFEVSSFTSILSKGRDKFPLLPPFVELPYIGTLAGIPLPAAREYHNSTAVISAVVVPTATDIAYSLRFTADRVIVGKPGPACVWTPTAGQPTCTVRKAVSLADFAGESPREFHRMKLFCLATLGASPYATRGDSPASSPDTRLACDDLTFANTLHDEVD